MKLSNIFLLVLPEDFIDQTKNISCDIDDEFVMGSFSFPMESVVNKTMAQRQCKKFCGANRTCSGCYLQCKNTCRWIAGSHCNDTAKPDEQITIEQSIKSGLR